MSDIPTGGTEPLDPNDSEQQLLDPNDPDFEEPPEPEEGEELEPEEGEELEPKEEGPPQPQQTARSRSSSGARWRERYEEARREADELRQQRQAPVQQSYVDPLAQQRAEQEWFQQLAQTDPAAAYQALWGRAQAQMQQALFLQNAQTTDRIDQQAYAALARTHKVYRDYQPAVERELAAARARMDYTTTREDIFHRLLGRDAADRAINAAPAQRRAAAQRVAGQRGQPTAGRSDAAQGNRRPAAGTPEDDDRLLREYFANGGRI